MADGFGAIVANDGCQLKENGPAVFGHHHRWPVVTCRQSKYVKSDSSGFRIRVLPLAQLLFLFLYFIFIILN